MKILLLTLLLFFVTQQPAWADTLEPPSSTALTVTTDVPGTLQVSWIDWSGERGYRVYSTTSVNPGDVFVPQSDWNPEAELAQNTTTFSLITGSPTRFLVCAFNEEFSSDTETAVACTQVSDLATPRRLPNTAEIKDLRVTGVGRTFIDVAWTETTSTRTSKISISPTNQTVIDDEDRRHRFNNLTPSTRYRIEGCVNSDTSDPSEGVCSVISQNTFDSPTSIDSISLIQSTPSSQTVEFSHTVSQDRPVDVYDVNLFRDDGNVIEQTKRIDGGSGRLTRRVTFSDLSPFTWYEIWVIPISSLGAAEGEGIGFTTPNQVTFTSVPLSGDSVMLEFDAKAIGGYTIEKSNGSTFSPVGTLRVLDPKKQKVVIDNISSEQNIRIKWGLAHLTSNSELKSVRPGNPGAPELIDGSIKKRFSFFNSNTQKFRVSALFRPMVDSRPPFVRKTNPIAYELVAERLTNISTSNGVERQLVTLATLKVPSNHDGGALSISSDALGLFTNIRVCQKRELNVSLSRRESCSANLEFKSIGATRFNL